MSFDQCSNTTAPLNFTLWYIANSFSNKLPVLLLFKVAESILFYLTFLHSSTQLKLSVQWSMRFVFHISIKEVKMLTNAWFHAAFLKTFMLHCFQACCCNRWKLHDRAMSRLTSHHESNVVTLWWWAGINTSLSYSDWKLCHLQN